MTGSSARPMAQSFARTCDGVPMHFPVFRCLELRNIGATLTQQVQSALSTMRLSDVFPVRDVRCGFEHFPTAEGFRDDRQRDGTGIRRQCPDMSSGWPTQSSAACRFGYPLRIDLAWSRDCRGSHVRTHRVRADRQADRTDDDVAGGQAPSDRPLRSTQVPIREMNHAREVPRLQPYPRRRSVARRQASRCPRTRRPNPMCRSRKPSARATPTGPVPSLAVLNAAGAKLEGGKLTLTGVAPSSIVFADRPVRAAGHVMTEQFIMQWDEGKDSFAKDPPNATVSVLGGDGSKVSDAVVTLKAPKLEGGNLTFDVVVLEGNLAGSSGPAALFIDHFGGFGGGGFHAGGFGGFHAAALVASTLVDSTPCALAGTMAARGLVAAIGTPPSIVVLGMGRVPGRRLALPPELRVGAAAASPYYGYGRCGYYPYPPTATRAFGSSNYSGWRLRSTWPWHRHSSKSKLLHHGTVNCCLIARSIHASRDNPALPAAWSTWPSSVGIKGTSTRTSNSSWPDCP